MPVVFQNSFLRIRRMHQSVPGDVEGAVQVTPETVDRATRILLGRKKAKTLLHVPPEALTQVGVRSVDELDLHVEDEQIVLRPKTTADEAS